MLQTELNSAVASRRFDFTWFIPAVIKYRRLPGDMFIASLCIRLFALITPLFFQVVMDKVLVHYILHSYVFSHTIMSACLADGLATLPLPDVLVWLITLLP